MIVKRWNACFLVQEKYGHAIHYPLATLRNVWQSAARGRSDEQRFIGPVQSLIVYAIVRAALAYVLVRFEESTQIEHIAVVYVALFWLFPLVLGNGVSMIRAEATLLPLAILPARLPQTAQSVFVAIFAFLYFEVGVAFFRSVLD